MKRRPARPQTSNHSAGHGHSGNQCRAIVPVDGSGIRKKIKRDYEKALRDLDNSRRQLDQFHQTDLPQFTRWLNSHFGAVLTEIRELSHQIAADAELIFQVQSEAMFGGGSFGRAYQRVMEAREEPGPPPPPPGGGDDAGGERDPFGERPGENFDGEDDPMEKFFEEMFGESGPGGPSEGDRTPGFGNRSGSTPPPRATSRLKELYRALVRRLHPDTQREMTPQKTEWWHQTQTAYEAGDEEQLEVILTLCEIGDSGTTAHTSASLLQRITANLKRSLRQIKRQIGEVRRDPAWGFSDRVDQEEMALQMGRVLARDLEGMRDRWREMQGLIAGWKAAAEQVKKPRRRKHRPQSMEFPF